MNRAIDQPPKRLIMVIKAHGMLNFVSINCVQMIVVVILLYVPVEN